MVHGQRVRLPLISLLLLDGLVYYISITSIHLTVLFTRLFADSTLALAVLGSWPAVATAGVACNRMLLRLQNVLLFDNVYASGIVLTTMDVSAGIGANAPTITTDEEGQDSIPG
jgi:hypothetical protein